MAFRFQSFSVAPVVSLGCHILGGSILYSSNEHTKTSREPLSLPRTHKRLRGRSWERWNKAICYDNYSGLSRMLTRKTIITLVERRFMTWELKSMTGFSSDKKKIISLVERQSQALCLEDENPSCWVYPCPVPSLSTNVSPIPY